MRIDNHSGGALRIKLTPEIARALERSPGWFVIRIGPELRDALEEEAHRREVLAGLPAGGVPLGQISAQILEIAWLERRLRTERTAAATCRGAIMSALKGGSPHD